MTEPPDIPFFEPSSSEPISSLRDFEDAMDRYEDFGDDYDVETSADYGTED